ncbi:MAG: hypothetical protein Q8896_14465, partial [Bacteroidota bacterium]|nr:hypothetical protein [Bacteroidota bacterium]
MGIPFLTLFLRRNQRSLRKSFFVFIFLGSFVSVLSAQTMRPQDLARDYLVKLVMNDSSQFYGIVLQKPLPDRILFQTRNGRLEIPLKDINYAVDYRFNVVMNSDLKKDALTNATDVEKYHLSQLLSLSKLESPSVVHTTNHDIF